MMKKRFQKFVFMYNQRYKGCDRTMSTFQKRLKELLDEKHLSQVDFAKKINVQKSTINGYILGLDVKVLSEDDEEIQIIDAYRNFGSEGKSILRNISKTNQ